MKPFISEHKDYYPDHKWISFLKNYFPDLVPFLSGQSLKHLRSQQNVLIFSLPEKVYNYYSQNIKNNKKIQTLINDISYFKNSFKLIIDRNKSFLKEDLHIIIQKNFVYPYTLISIDRLRFNTETFQWEGSQEDLNDFRKGMIRIIKPETLDIMQSLNLIVFASMLDFSFEPTTLSKINEISSSLTGKDFNKLDINFLRKQFSKILVSAKPSTGFILLHQTGLLKWFLPELEEIYDLKINDYDKFDLFHYCIYTCDSISIPELPLRITGLFYNLGRKQEKSNTKEKSYYNFEILSAKIAYKIMKRFQFSNDLTQRVYFLIRHQSFFNSDNVTQKALRKFLKKTSDQNLQDMVSYRLSQRKNNLNQNIFPFSFRKIFLEREKMIEEESRLRIKDLKIDGNDLKELGIEPGPIYGKILKYLLSKVEEKTFPNEKEILLKEVKSYIKVLQNLS